ncbi:16S rRNA methyltransferase, partial [Candidatus Azambacteria bacterium]|nr:16S rRNA methyltransferase [Candidatus Azambacteria bacterium]
MGQKLGQHFLVNKGVIQKIVNAASLEKSDVVLEIGPGTGLL